MVEWGYSRTHFPRDQTKASVQLRATTAVFPETEPAFHIRWEASKAPEPTWVLRKETRTLATAGNRTMNPRLSGPYRSHYTA